MNTPQVAAMLGFWAACAGSDCLLAAGEPKLQKSWVADAGEDRHVPARELVVLDGTASHLPTAEAVRFRWRQTAGPRVSLDHADHPLARFTAPAAGEKPVSLEFELTLASRDRTVADRVSVTVLPDMPLSGAPFYGMEVVRVGSGDGCAAVTTTGGLYEITPDGIQAWRRIRPVTNSCQPRKVARIRFSRSVGPVTVDAADRQACSLTSAEGLRVRVHSDSLVLLTATGRPLRYTYQSLLSSPPWAKGTRGDFYYNDGDGGSCHYMHPTTPGTYTGPAGVPDDFAVVLEQGGGSAFGVFPPRPFDFNGLYGRNARPSAAQLYSYVSIQPGGGTWSLLDRYRSLGVGTFNLFAFLFYENVPAGVTDRLVDPHPAEYSQSKPVFNRRTNRWEYVYAHAEIIRRFVEEAHGRGFRVITYFSPPDWEAVTKSPLQDALPWMREFQREHGLDGWYLDGPGDLKHLNWLKTYEFIRCVRKDVGEDGVIWLHASVDPWGFWDGRVLVHAETYATLTLKGETGTLAATHSPNDPYVPYYAVGYGNSQSLAIAMQMASGFGRGSLRNEERARLMGTVFAGEGVTGTELDILAKWYRPAYLENQRRFHQGSLLQEPPWPVSWFEDVPVRAAAPSRTSIRLSWDTAELTVSEVRYLAEQPQYGYSFDDRVWVSGQGWQQPPVRVRMTDVPTTSHALIVRGLQPATTYYVRVRCSPPGPAGTFNPAARKVYGGFAAVRTPGT